MSLRTERKKREAEEKTEARKRSIKQSIQSRIEEFRLNRKGMTKKKRSEVMANHRRVDRHLTAAIIIVSLLLLITWVIILNY